MIDHPAGDAIRFEYEAKVNAAGEDGTLAFLQHSVMGDGELYTLTFTTLPKLMAGYKADFERSAESFRLS